MAKHHYKSGDALAEKAHSRSGISKKLVRAVFKQLGSTGEELESTLRDVMNHGAAGGFSGFIYYTETCKFYQRNKKDIVAKLKSDADDFGEEGGIIGLVKKFKCGADSDEEAIAKTLYGSAKEADDQVENCLAWYALEEVARAAMDE